MRVRICMAALALVSLGAVSACSKSSPVAPDRVGAGAVPSGSLAETVAIGAEGPEQVKNFPIDWTLTVAECPALWADSLTGQGTLTTKTRVTTLGNGTFHFKVTEHASGAATDTNGGVFKFSYANSLKLLEQSPAVTLTLKDHFTIKGPDKSLTFRIVVDAHLKVDATGTVVFNTVKSRGPIACDPV